MYQTSKDKVWKDETGMEIPYSRIRKSERLQEKSAFTLMQDATKINTSLTEFKAKMRKVCQEVYDTFMAEKDNKKASKGNFTWYNFDRSIKIEVSINERIDFDDMTINAAKDKFDEFLNQNLQTNDQFVKDMIMDAFSTSRGKLDAKKVLNLVRYKSRIKAALFQEAISLLEQSIRRPESKTYFRIWVKDENGQYENIELNFSNI